VRVDVFEVRVGTAPDGAEEAAGPVMGTVPPIVIVLAVTPGAPPPAIAVDTATAASTITSRRLIH